MDIDTPEATPIEQLDERFDLGSLAASFGTQSLRVYFQTTQSPRIETCPVLMHIMGNAQILLKALMFMRHSHGAWKDHRGHDFKHYRPTEPQIALIAFKSSFMLHHRLAAVGMAQVAEHCA